MTLYRITYDNGFVGVWHSWPEMLAWVAAGAAIGGTHIAVSVEDDR